jgi:hypothetical protein
MGDGSNPRRHWRLEPKMQKKFWTITSEHTTHTNDRSTRFENKAAAVTAAEIRLATNTLTTGVFILEAVALVKRTTPPVEIIPIDE